MGSTGVTIFPYGTDEPTSAFDPTNPWGIPDDVGGGGAGTMNATVVSNTIGSSNT